MHIVVPLTSSFAYSGLPSRRKPGYGFLVNGKRGTPAFRSKSLDGRPGDDHARRFTRVLWADVQKREEQRGDSRIQGRIVLARREVKRKTI